MHEEIYKGYNITIEQDEIYDSPDSWEDPNLFLVANSRNFVIERQGFSERDLTEDPDGYEIEVPETYKNLYENGKKYHVFPINVYDTIYISSSSNPSGYIFVACEEIEDRDEAMKLANGLIEEWNHCLLGNVWGYIITKDDICEHCHHNEPEDIDSCWGFIGDYEYCLDEARTTVDAIIKNNEERILARMRP